MVNHCFLTHHTYFMSVTNSAPDLLPDSTARWLQAIRDRTGKIVVGQDVVVERTLIALLTSGHLLLEGMPGLAKTLLVNTVAKVSFLRWRL